MPSSTNFKSVDATTGLTLLEIDEPAPTEDFTVWQNWQLVALMLDRPDAEMTVS